MTEVEMSNMCFSPSRLSFYPAAWQYDGTYNEETWPSDAVLLTVVESSAYYGANPPIGKTLGALDGRPVWVDVVVPERPLPEIADEKRNEMRTACSDEITRSSFQSSALGAVHNYDCRLVDQINLKMRLDIAGASGSTEHLWASDGTRYQWKSHTAEEILNVMIDMNGHIKSSQVKLASLLAAVDAATNKAQIDTIAW